MSTRRLVSQRRTVSPGESEAYATLWEALRFEVEAYSGHAWRFVSTIHPDSHLEFLEFAQGSDPRSRPAVSAALAALDALAAAGDCEEWEERRDAANRP